MKENALVGMIKGPLWFCKEWFGLMGLCSCAFLFCFLGNYYIGFQMVSLCVPCLMGMCCYILFKLYKVFVSLVLVVLA